MCYFDRSGKRIRESTFTEDWQEANKKLRERLGARDNRVLEIVRKGEQMGFEPWGDFFLENYSKPPIRAAKTHNANLRATKHPKATFQEGFDTVLTQFATNTEQNESYRKGSRIRNFVEVV